MKYLKLNDIEAYKIAFNFSNYICDIVIKWDYFAQETIGSQNSFPKSIHSLIKYTNEKLTE